MPNSKKEGQMAEPNVLEGRKFRLYRSDGTAGPGRFKFFCLATDLGVKRSTEFEDVTVNDCDTPSLPARQKSTPRLLKTEVNCGGAVDALKLQVLKADWESQVQREFQVIYDETGAAGGETETFFAYVEELETSKQNAGAVKFTAKLKVQGAPARAALV
jgi:hypothetical protein